MSTRIGALSRLRWRALLTALVVVGTTVAFGGPVAAAPPGSSAPRDVSAASASTPQIVPAPVSMTTGQGQFTMTRHTRIVASGAARAIGNDLRADLRPATGFPLPVVSGHPHAGDIVLRLGDPGTLAADTTGEGYQLNVTSGRVTLEAPTAHGLFNGVQTIRQLLPPWIAGATTRSGPWTMPVTTITDYPRYGYRGLMLDIARHYQTPQAVKKLLDEAAAYKIDRFHLHLSDDQGFRIVINGFPRLTAIGGQGSVGTEGRTMDPGGYWTQAQYESVVAYAAARFITVIPEVDTPGHTNAIIMSEYDDTANPLLNGHPQDINCSVNNPPQWNYTGAVGYSALCPSSDNTWTILGAIIGQLSAMSPGPYYNIGGDEVPTSVLSQDQYAALVNREGEIVNANGKTVMGWAEIAGEGTELAPGSVAEYWNPASGSDPSTATATEAVAKGMKLVMAPANHAYLDQKYARNVPSSIGLTWACGRGGCDVDQFYNWDPATYVTGVGDDVIGVEGAMWAETVRNISEVEYMVFPRLLALAELGWSPQVTRTIDSAAYQDFLVRLAAQGARLAAAGTNFYPSPEVPWRLDLTGVPAANHGGSGRTGGALATLSAPGVPADEITATIDWGDGTTTTGLLTGSPATATSVNGLYTISGSHSYRHGRAGNATITVTAPDMSPVTLQLALGRHGNSGRVAG